MNTTSIKTKAIVLKEIRLREADKILVCLSSELGKFSVSARGAKNQKNKNIAAASFMTYSEMILYSSRSMYSLSQTNVIESFYNIRKDIVKLTYASYFADILLDSIQENEESEHTLRLLLNILYYLMDDNISPAYLATLFEFRLLKYIGFKFNTDRHCSKCKSEDVSHVSISRGGFICRDCHTQGTFLVTDNEMETIDILVNLPLKKAIEMKISNDLISSIRKISVKYLTMCLDKYYTKLDFLDTL